MALSENTPSSYPESLFTKPPFTTAWDTYQYQYDLFSDSTETPFSGPVVYTRERHLTGTFRPEHPVQQKNTVLHRHPARARPEPAVV